jgi:hypothetical protein
MGRGAFFMDAGPDFCRSGNTVMRPPIIAARIADPGRKRTGEGRVSPVDRRLLDRREIERQNSEIVVFVFLELPTVVTNYDKSIVAVSKSSKGRWLAVVIFLTLALARAAESRPCIHDC